MKSGVRSAQLDFVFAVARIARQLCGAVFSENFKLQLEGSNSVERGILER